MQAIDPILGPYSQALDRIGATDIMVCRITSTAYRVGGVRALASPALAVRKKVGCSLNNYSLLDFTLRRWRGAIGRYQAAPGAPLAAARVPPTAMDAAPTIPARGG